MSEEPARAQRFPTHHALEEVWDLLAGHLALSPREGEVSLGIMKGQSDKRIALNLGISVHTIHTYKRRLFRKLGVQRRTEVAVVAFHAAAERRPE